MISSILPIAESGVKKDIFKIFNRVPYQHNICLLYVYHCYFSSQLEAKIREIIRTKLGITRKAVYSIYIIHTQALTIKLYVCIEIEEIEIYSLIVLS